MLIYGEAALKGPTQDDFVSPRSSSLTRSPIRIMTPCDSEQTLANTCFCVARSGPDRWPFCSSFVLEVMNPAVLCQGG